MLKQLVYLNHILNSLNLMIIYSKHLEGYQKNTFIYDKAKEVSKAHNQFFKRRRSRFCFITSYWLNDIFQYNIGVFY